MNTKQESTQLMLDWLGNEGYRPSLDRDGDLVFKREGKSYLILFEEGDPMFMRLIFPNFWSIDSEAERAPIAQACTLASANTKVAKVFPVGDNVWASIELFCTSVGQFQGVFERSLSALGSAVERFVREMRNHLPQA